MPALATAFIQYAEINNVSVSGSRGVGFYRLNITVTVNRRTPRDTTLKELLTDIEGYATIRTETGNINNLGSLCFYKKFNVISDLDINGISESVEMKMFVDVSLQGIDKIESLRMGRGCEISVYLNAKVERQHYESPNNRLVRLEVFYVSSEIGYTINQGTWIDILSQMGYRETMLLEIPIIDEFTTTIPSLKTDFDMAQTQLLLGHWRQSVEACRKIYEALSQKMNDKKVTDKVEFKEISKEDKMEHIRLLRRAMYIITCKASHIDDVNKPDGDSVFEWGPEDARAALMITSALVRWVFINQNDK